MYKTKSGFTIVELLIVIVVIGILASVTVVAYNGVSARAVDSEKVSEVAMIKKKLDMFKIDNGHYPCSQAIAGTNGVTTLGLPISALQSSNQDSWITGITDGGGAPAGSGTKGYVIGTWPNADGSGFYQSTGQCQSYTLSYYSFPTSQTVYLRNPER